MKRKAEHPSQTAQQSRKANRFQCIVLPENEIVPNGVSSNDALFQFRHLK